MSGIKYFRGRLYSGNSDLRLECISFDYYGEARGGSCVPPAEFMDLEPGAVRSLCSNPLGQIFRPDNCLFGLSIPTEGAELTRRDLPPAKNSNCLQGDSNLSLHVCSLGESAGQMQKYVNRSIQSRTRCGRCRSDQFVLR